VGGFEIMEGFGKMLLGERSEKERGFSFDWLVEVD
jgi:hypothetical protein